MIRFPLFSALFTLFVTAVAPGQCPTTGDCREVHETSGCEMPECCTLVCEYDMFCCETGWSESCVQAALELCEDIWCPAAGACSVIHPTPGCDAFECCDLITTLDGWCTYAAWDEICALEAEALCGEARCDVAIPAVADESEPCYDRLNDGWGIGLESGRITLSCGESMKGRITGGGPRDLDWFTLDGSARRRIRFSIEAEFPVELQYLLGDSEGPSEVKWLVAEPICGGERSIVLLTEPGVSSLILGAGNGERPYRSGLDCDETDPDFPPDPKDPPPLQLYGVRWVASIACLELGDINGDGSVSAADLSLLLTAWGPRDLGSAFDPRAADADLDGDGMIGAADLSLMLAGW
jgi:hypothetical protein